MQFIPARGNFSDAEIIGGLITMEKKEEKIDKEEWLDDACPIGTVGTMVCVLDMCEFPLNEASNICEACIAKFMHHAQE